MKRRRDLIGMLSVAAAWPRFVFGQQPAMRVVGVLTLIPRNEASPNWRAFISGLGSEGFVEGRNFEFDYRWPEGHVERLPALTAGLVERRVAIIAALSGTLVTLAARKATSTIPIVFVEAGDPVENGLVTSFKGPNGNVTGAALLQEETFRKQIELISEVIPGNAPLGVLIDPTLELAAAIEKSRASLMARLGRPIVVADAALASELEGAFKSIKQQKAAGLVIPGGPLYSNSHGELAALAAQYDLPTVFPNGDLASSGGLMSYGANPADGLRQAGVYVGKILKGAKPADLPVVQPSKITLKINLKTAKVLGLAIPPPLLARADEVIE